MTKNSIYSLIGLFVLIGIYLFIGNSVQATLAQQVTLTYPIPQLGSCRDAKECYFYCEIPRHQPVCQQFFRSRNLNRVLGVSTTPSLSTLHQYAQSIGITYPVQELNNCTDHYSCKSFCNLPKNYSSCTTFAKNHGLLVPSRYPPAGGPSG